MKTRANGIEIEYETFGNAGDDPLLLVMGLGGQLTLWDEAFCQMLADRGHYTIRFDNRDVGLSTHFDKAGAPNLVQLMTASANGGEPPEVAYTLDDMADDAAGLLDALSIERAHLVGASMGGMIARTVAIRHPDRVKSLVSIMSNTGHPDSPVAKPEVLAVLMQPPAETREAAIEGAVATWEKIGSPGFPFDEERIRARSARDYDRAYHPEGTARQLAAVTVHGDREPALSKLSTPTLVIHGSDDPLVPPGNGQRTADAIPGAELLMIEGMGHDMPPGAFAQITDAIATHAKLSSRAS